MSTKARLVRTTAIVMTSALLLGACADTQGGPKENVGTLLGAIGGGVAGAQFGSGRGQLAAVAAGTLLGAVLGNQVGKSLDRADHLAMASAHSTAMTAPVGETITWSNPDSGNYGSTRTVREGTSSSGAYCREYQSTVTVGGKQQDAYGTACRRPDGSWEILSR